MKKNSIFIITIISFTLFITSCAKISDPILQENVDFAEQSKIIVNDNEFDIYAEENNSASEKNMIQLDQHYHIDDQGRSHYFAADGTQNDLSSLPEADCYPETEPSTKLSTYDDYMARIRLDDTVIFRGKKAGLSTQRKSKSWNFYNETPLEVLEVYYGDLSVGKTITCIEDAFVTVMNGQAEVNRYGACNLIETEEEYLFILFKGESAYTAGSLLKPFIKISEIDNVKNTIEPSLLDERNQKLAAVYLAETYVPQLDLYAEVSKLTDEKLDPNGSPEDWLTQLTKEQKDLVKKMIGLYGVK